MSSKRPSRTRSVSRSHSKSHPEATGLLHPQVHHQESGQSDPQAHHQETGHAHSISHHRGSDPLHSKDHFHSISHAHQHEIDPSHSKGHHHETHAIPHHHETDSLHSKAHNHETERLSSKSYHEAEHLHSIGHHHEADHLHAKSHDHLHSVSHHLEPERLHGKSHHDTMAPHLHPHGVSGKCDENVIPDPKTAKHLMETCCKNVTVPPLLPPILKAYTKGAIRTQPKDLLHWSLAYFRAMERGEIPPVKDRLEFPVIETRWGLSAGILRVLNNQLGSHHEIPINTLLEKWSDLCLDECKLLEFLQDEHLIHTDHQTVDWDHFLVSAAASLSNDHHHNSVVETMKLLCQTLYHGLDAKNAAIPFSRWWSLYLIEVGRKHIDGDKVRTLQSYLEAKSKHANGNIGIDDFLDHHCPPLS